MIFKIYVYLLRARFFTVTEQKWFIYRQFLVNKLCDIVRHCERFGPIFQLFFPFRATLTLDEKVQLCALATGSRSLFTEDFRI